MLHVAWVLSPFVFWPLDLGRARPSLQGPSERWESQGLEGGDFAVFAKYYPSLEFIILEEDNARAKGRP